MRPFCSELRVSMMTEARLIVAIAVFGLVSVAQGQTVRYVDASRPDDSGNGLSWAAAKRTLQAALVPAVSGDEIWVKQGIYKPDQGPGISLGDRTATFQLENGVEIYGGFAGSEIARDQRDWEANETILDGDLNGNDAPLPCTLNSQCSVLGGLCFNGSCITPQNNAENSYHVVTGSNNATTAVLDGFTIRGGNADGPSAFLQDLGAGVFNNSGSPTLSNCLITGNSAESAGGGMTNLRQSGNPNAEPIVRNCALIGNSAGLGGAIYTAGGNSVPKVSNCIFMANVATLSTGGGAMVMLNASPVIFNSEFIGNAATGGNGGAIANSGSSQITNCVFSGNTANNHGGALYISAGAPVVTNCTFSANSAPLGAGGGVRAVGGTGLVRTCIFWGNTDDGSLDATAQIDGITPSYSIVQFFVSGGVGNSGADPLLVDFDGQDNVVGTADDNLRLRLGSPAVDAGNSLFVPADTLDLDEDSNTTERTPLDLSEEARFRDDLSSTDTGVDDEEAGYPVVDIGAYEYVPRLYVDADATGGNDGSTWSDAFVHLRDALAEAVTGTEMWVAEGIYRPHLKGCSTVGDCGGPPNVCAPVGMCIWDQIRTQTFQLQSGVALYGGFAGDETELSQRDVDAHPTILRGDLAGDDAPVPCAQNSPDCDLFGGLCHNDFCIVRDNNDENSYHVITSSGTDSTARLDGFTIAGGNANGNVDLFGGGVYSVTGSPTIESCVLRSNSAVEGGGIFCSGGSPTIAQSIFLGNYAALGGGMRSTSSTPTVTDSHFVANVAGDGGGFHSTNGSMATLTNCTFSKNRALNTGGGFLANGDTSVVNCIFSSNYAISGGAMQNQAYLGNVTNCVFNGNFSETNGGAVVNTLGSTPTMTNCTFSGNDAVGFGGGIYNSSSGANSPAITNSIFWKNSDGKDVTDESAQIHTDSGAPSVFYSLVQGGWSGAGSNNVNADPLFFDADGADNMIGTLDDDLRPRAGSPAIDAGDTTALPLDTLDLDGDANTTEYIPFDLAGNPRQFDDPDTVDTGIPGSPVVDMGAYEYFTDCNGNGVEDSVDIAQSTSEDCDWDGGGPNGIPDECDIAACPERTCTGGINAGAPCSVNAECESDVCSDPSSAACGDCNLNDQPDGCDIDLGSSLDVAPADGVPDECVNFTGGCNPPSNEWSCGGNWSLAGDYPDNDVDTYSVVLNGTADAVCLDVPVEIDSLAMVAGSSLQVTQPDPPCDGAAAARGPTGTTLDVVADGGLVVQDSSLTVSADNVVNVSGSMIIGPGGVYSLDGGATALSSAVLNAAEIRIVGSDCGSPPCPDGGMMDLTDQMEVHTTGDLIVDGSLANGDCDPVNRAASAALSFHTPPIKRVQESAVLDVDGDLVYAGAATVVCDSTEPVTVGGDFENQSVRPDCFDYLNGSMRLTDGGMHEFEVAAVDVGPVDSLAEAQFSMGSLEIGANASVTFSDRFDNDLSGQGSCTEAVYVGALILEAGASILAKNCRIYYETLTAHETSSIQTEGCGEVRHIQNPADPEAIAGAGGEAKNRFFSFIVPAGGAGMDAAVRVELTSLHHPAGPPNAPNFTAFEGQHRYLNAIRDGANNPVFVCPDSVALGTTYKCAKLGCSPEYRDWAGIFGGQAVHVTGDTVVPSSQYAVAQLAVSCAGQEASCTAVSNELLVTTERWGNVDNAPAGGTPNAIDIGKVVDKVKDIPSAFIESRCQLREATPSPYTAAVNAQDIGRVVDAVKGQPYPFTISVCP